jgi:hypothetical protein
MKGQYQFTKSVSLDNFKIVDNKISMDFHPRHGTVIAITRKELQTLIKKWGVPKNFPIVKNNPTL